MDIEYTYRLIIDCKTGFRYEKKSLRRYFKRKHFHKFSTSKEYNIPEKQMIKQQASHKSPAKVVGEKKRQSANIAPHLYFVLLGMALHHHDHIHNHKILYRTPTTEPASKLPVPILQQKSADSNTFLATSSSSHHNNEDIQSASVNKYQKQPHTASSKSRSSTRRKPRGKAIVLPSDPLSNNWEAKKRRILRRRAWLALVCYLSVCFSVCFSSCCYLTSKPIIQS